MVCDLQGDEIAKFNFRTNDAQLGTQAKEVRSPVTPEVKNDLFLQHGTVRPTIASQKAGVQPIP